MSTEVREIPAGQTALATQALLELRPQFRTAEALVAQIDLQQRPQGYRLIGAFGSEEPPYALAVAGFRTVRMLAWGLGAIYVDDLVTRAAHRGAGHAGALVRWLLEEAPRQECDELHLDSGVGADRQDAHRFYFRQGMRITSYHFARKV